MFPGTSSIIDNSNRKSHTIAFQGMSPGEAAAAMAAREKGHLHHAQIQRRLTTSKKRTLWLKNRYATRPGAGPKHYRNPHESDLHENSPFVTYTIHSSRSAIHSFRPGLGPSLAFAFFYGFMTTRQNAARASLTKILIGH
jgi:hypothetical protein